MYSLVLVCFGRNENSVPRSRVGLSPFEADGTSNQRATGGLVSRKPMPEYTYVNLKGYVLVYAPERGPGRYKLAHRSIMEQFLGRKLTKEEIVHHIDGNRSNNNIDNLAVMTRAQHLALHFPTNKRVAKIAECHPDRPHCAFGLCRKCYMDIYEIPAQRARRAMRKAKMEEAGNG